MRFSRSTNLLMFLSLKTLTSIIRTGLPFLVELIDLGNSVIIFLSQMTLLRWLTVLRGSQAVIVIHGVKGVRIRSYSGPHFSRIFPHSDWIWRDTPESVFRAILVRIFPRFFCIWTEYGEILSIRRSISPYSVRMWENPGKILTRITPNTDSFYAVIVLPFSTCFFLLTLVFVAQWLSLHSEILIMLLSQFPLTFHQIHNETPRFIE